MEQPIQFWQGVALVSAQLFLSLLLFIIIISAIVFLTRKPLRKYKPLDLAVFDRLAPLGSPRLDRFMLFITFLGKHQFLVPANLVLLSYFIFISRQSLFSIRVVAIAVSSLVLMLVLKQLFHRQRPLKPLLGAVKGLSFPSGHAIMAVSFYGLLIYLLGQTIDNQLLFAVLTFLLLLLILLIGFSRIWLRVHYASDVLAGFIIGLLWLLISLLILKRVEDYFQAV